MASIPCAIHLYPLPSSSSIATAKRQPSSFWCIILSSLGLRRRFGFRVSSWFRSRKKGVDAGAVGAYGGQNRDDFDRNHVELYFKYMGMFAVERSYDRTEALLSQNIHPVDILLIIAACKGDKPKIEELLRAGASFDVKDVEGRTAVDRASKDEIKDFILRFSL